MNPKSLKDSLERWAGFPKLERTFEPRLTRVAASEVEKRLGEGQMKQLSTYDLEELYQRVIESWRQDRSFERVSGRDLRRLPQVLFFPPPNDNRVRRQRPNSWLGAQPGIVREYGRWLLNGQRGGPVRELLKQFLGVYPVDLPTFEDLRQLLRKTVEGSSSPSLRAWQHRCQEFGFLRKDGDLSFVGKLVSATDFVDDFLVQAGLEAGLARCGFLKSGIRKYLPNVSTRLTREDIDDTQLARVLKLLECEGKLRFEEQSICVKVASALLGPYVGTPPPAHTRDQLQRFFLHHFGDPRLPSGRHRWYGVGEEVRHVVSRWLVKEALDGFIRLVKETALDQHWRYRERFWMACFNQGIIDDAWFVLGSRARILLRRLEDHRPGATGRLSGASPEQSVLLLRMSGVTIAEWSHNGSCRMWLDGNKDAPKLYQGRDYSGAELRRGSDLSQRHDGSEFGRWQDQVARWLRENIGASIGRGEYMRTERSGAARRRHGRRYRI